MLGDLVADEYVFGRPERVSREAPVLILRYLSTETRLGGAANACHNLQTLGARVVALGVVGEDAAGAEVRHALSQRGVHTDGVIPVPSGRPPSRPGSSGEGSDPDPPASRSFGWTGSRRAIPPGTEAILVERLRSRAGADG